MTKILVLLAPGFEEIEAVTVIDLLRRAGIGVTTASITMERQVEGSHDIAILADAIFEDLETDKFDGIFLPGGQPGSNNLRENNKVLETLRSFDRKRKWVTAICAAPLVLLEAGILTGHKVTSYPDEKGAFAGENYQDKMVVHDGHIITSRGVGTAVDLALRLVELLQNKDIRDQLAERILWK